MKTLEQVRPERFTRREFVSATAGVPTPASFEPEFIRLPKPGFLCPYSGLSRSAINELILPTPRNDFKPPVRSYCLRQRGAQTGIRLVNYASLRDFIRAHEESIEGQSNPEAV